MAKDFVDLRDRENDIGRFPAFFGMLARCDYAHVQGFRYSGYRTADAAQSDESEGRASEFANTAIFVPYFLLTPLVPLLETNRVGNFPGEGKDHGHHMLCYYRAMYFARVGKHDIALH